LEYVQRELPIVLSIVHHASHVAHPAPRSSSGCAPKFDETPHAFDMQIEVERARLCTLSIGSALPTSRTRACQSPLELGSGGVTQPELKANRHQTLAQNFARMP